MELATTALESADNVLGGRLEQSHNVCDEFVLALDSGKCVELVGTEVNGFFDVSSLQQGQCVAFLNEVFEQFCRRVAHVGAHQRSRLLECGVEFGVIAFEVFESLAEELVLHNNQLDVGVEASTAKFGGLFGIESGSFYEVEAVVCLDSFLYFADYNRFIFLLDRKSVV